MKYILYIRSKLSKCKYGKNLSRLPYIPNDKCEELLAKSEKMVNLVVF